MSKEEWVKLVKAVKEAKERARKKAVDASKAAAAAKKAMAKAEATEEVKADETTEDAKAEATGEVGGKGKRKAKDKATGEKKAEATEEAMEVGKAEATEKVAGKGKRKAKDKATGERKAETAQEAMEDAKVKATKGAKGNAKVAPKGGVASHRAAEAAAERAAQAAKTAAEAKAAIDTVPLELVDKVTQARICRAYAFLAEEKSPAEFYEDGHFLETLARFLAEKGGVPEGVHRYNWESALIFWLGDRRLDSRRGIFFQKETCMSQTTARLLTTALKNAGVILNSFIENVQNDGTPLPPPTAACAVLVSRRMVGSTATEVAVGPYLSLLLSNSTTEDLEKAIQTKQIATMPLLTGAFLWMHDDSETPARLIEEAQRIQIQRLGTPDPPQVPFVIDDWLKGDRLILEVKYLITEEESEGRGLASRLMLKIIEIAQELGVRIIFLQSRIQAVAFYTSPKLGFLHMQPEQQNALQEALIHAEGGGQNSPWEPNCTQLYLPIGEGPVDPLESTGDPALDEKFQCLLEKFSLVG
uniref:N-acetyltransferase domain-containing protein n=1 Tax=Chromera velia CCMP2878 TaxID=1169474 RepID=A0A0G4FU55_9ALVE|eukprot:Cvel_3762.t1-p1 / transcript=Cvel_3762.t1 / gene=Cvel_3762 / organism=Chromera_velia_CCMP2878 / gene_product=hypothetical protein / transcript_product=hypothetical protein / location=Cvel_scaffold157:109654-114447(-) / protein_length=528 / sequence_SO=supercontig / SO=protein_coding / is_pseudo=false